jgi:hypothetical protein
MQHSTQVKWLVNGLRRRHNLDLLKEGEQLYLRRWSSSLILEVLRPSVIRITTHIIRNSRTILESDVVFFVSGNRWYPIQEADMYGNFRCFVLLANDENGVIQTKFNQPGQLDLAIFCDSWAERLRLEGWLHLELLRLPSSAIQSQRYWQAPVVVASS